MAMTLRRTGSIAEINVTPMADVMIVLLIIFMVATPLISGGPVERLPDAESARVHPEGPLKVSMSAASVLYFRGARMADADALSVRLREALERSRARLVYVEADTRLPYEAVAGLLARCREAGADEVALIATPRGSR